MQNVVYFYRSTTLLYDGDKIDLLYFFLHNNTTNIVKKLLAPKLQTKGFGEKRTNRNFCTFFL